MAEIILESVDISFPIYDVRGRSLRKDLLRVGIGGRIGKDAQDHVVVNALEDVSLSIREGDRVGVIGQNGAGKSTLLRVMAGIYEPVMGRVRVRGRVVPMFDMMLGMDPDSSGYENIRLSGMFMGLSPRQIADLSDDIAEFSDLGDYLHMPVRTYSSGMIVRLGFGISTSISPDILLMDEMIGAGDSAFFQRAEKRLAKFVDSASILVIASHSDAVIRQWCNKAVLLNHGRVEAAGPVDDVLARYAAMG